MKALQDRGVAKEGVIARLHKRIKILTNEQEQYKGAVRMVLKTGTVKKPEKRLITGFLVRPGSDRWSNR